MCVTGHFRWLSAPVFSLSAFGHNSQQWQSVSSFLLLQFFPSTFSFLLLPVFSTIVFFTTLALLVYSILTFHSSPPYFSSSLFLITNAEQHWTVVSSLFHQACPSSCQWFMEHVWAWERPVSPMCLIRVPCRCQFLSTSVKCYLSFSWDCPWRCAGGCELCQTLVWCWQGYSQPQDVSMLQESLCCCVGKAKKLLVC